MKTRRRSRIAAIVAAICVAPLTARQDHDHAAMSGEKLGTVHFTTSCSQTAAPIFDRAVALLHSFEFGPAVDGFNATLAADPSCAIAEWGIALARWGNPFAVGARSAAQLQQGKAAIDRGRTIGFKTDRERGYLDAAAMLYTDTETKPQPARVAAYRDAMGNVAGAHRDDMEAQIFFALSLTAAEDINDKTYASRLRAVSILEPLFKAHPDHPGLAHYIIHSYDVPALAPKALVAARSYASIAPSAPHALHMPSHIFTRVGSWQESIDTNLKSAAAAREQNTPGEELHATDYLVYAYLQSAQDMAAKKQLDALPDIMRRFSSGTGVASAAPPSAGAFAFAAIPARWTLERGAWSDAAKLEIHPSALPYADALTAFARAIGGARSFDLTTARAALADLDRLHDAEAKLNEAYWTEQIDIQRRVASAWITFADGHQADALTALRAAADAEDRTEKAAVTPGPLAPARELLGDMLLEMKQPAAALQEFKATLAKEPNRYRTLSGAMRAAEALGDPVAARNYAGMLVDTTPHADKPTRPDLDRARRLAKGAIEPTPSPIEATVR